MSTVVRCPTCGIQMSVGQESQGGLVRCPKCATVLKIPGAPPPGNLPVPPAPARASVPPPPVRKAPPPPTVSDSLTPVSRPAAPARKAAAPGSERRGGAVKTPAIRPPAAGPEAPKGKRPPKWVLVGAATGCGVAVLGVIVVGLIVGVIAWRARSDRGKDGATADSAPTANQPAEEPAPPALPLVEVPPGPVPPQIDPASLGKVKQATAYLRVKLPNGEMAEGSGFFCAAPGIVMTNAHVLGMLRGDSLPPREVEVVAHNGERDELKMIGTVLGVDRTNDLAVLRVPGEAGRLPDPLPVDTAGNLFETQKVYVFGFPLGARLGKNITVSESSVSSLRRDDAGRLKEVQVNGGMHPGNSGGPVADARGVVVGVSVAIIQGTQINFAIPGDLVRQVLGGRLDRSELGTAYQEDDGQTRLPVKAACLDPLSRVREVKFDVWTGPSGEERPPSDRAPEPKPGDGPSSTVTCVRRGGGFAADVPLPRPAPGQVCWVRPVLVKVSGESEWEKAVPVPLEGRVVVRRRPTAIRFQAPPDRVERTLRVTSAATAQVFQSKEVGTLRLRFEGDALESSGPDPRGIGTFVRLTIGPSTFHVETPSKKADAPRQAGTLLSQFSPTFLVDASHACKERGKRNFTGVAPALRDTVEGMYEGVCNCFESTTLPLPNREVRPLESWQARMPLFVLTRGKRTIQDIFLTCTYEGVTAVNGRQEAYVSLAGEVKGRGPAAARPLGKARGYAHVDVEKGFLALVQLTVSSEVEVEESGVRVLVNEESTMRRKEGNLLGIVAATRNQPGAPPAPPIRRR